MQDENGVIMTYSMADLVALGESCGLYVYDEGQDDGETAFYIDGSANKNRRLLCLGYDEETGCYYDFGLDGSKKILKEKIADKNEIIDFVINKFKDFNTNQIIEYMHKEKAYIETKETIDK